MRHSASRAPPRRTSGRFAIRVNALAPGPIGTEALLRRLVEREAGGGLAAEEALRRYAETPLATHGDRRRRWRVPRSSSQSGLSGGITGQLIPVDAGLTS